MTLKPFGCSSVCICKMVTSGRWTDKLADSHSIAILLSGAFWIVCVCVCAFKAIALRSLVSPPWSDPPNLSRDGQLQHTHTHTINLFSFFPRLKLSDWNTLSPFLYYTLFPLPSFSLFHIPSFSLFLSLPPLLFLPFFSPFLLHSLSLFPLPTFSLSSASFVLSPSHSLSSFCSYLPFVSLCLWWQRVWLPRRRAKVDSFWRSPRFYSLKETLSVCRCPSRTSPSFYGTSNPSLPVRYKQTVFFPVILYGIVLYSSHLFLR